MGLMHPMYDHSNVKISKYGKKATIKKVYKEHGTVFNKWEKFKPSDAQLLQLRASQNSSREQAAAPGIKLIIKSMEDLDNWDTTTKVVHDHTIPDNFCIAPAYNKGGYMVIPANDIKN